MSSKRVWVVLPDQLSTRLFVDTGIVAGLSARLRRPSRARARRRRSRLDGRDRRRAALDAEALVPERVSGLEGIHRSVDRALDRVLGYYPLAIRLNLRHGFHRERMAPGHENWMLDSVAGRPAAPLEVGRARDEPRGTSSRARYVPRALRESHATGLRRARPLERPAAGRRALSRRRAAPRHSARRARRELGPHRRQGRHRTVLRRLRRPERRRCETISSATTTSRPSGSWSPAGRRRTSTRARARERSSNASSASYGLDAGTPARRRHGEHADERALRGSLRRAARRLVGGGGPRTDVPPLPAASARPCVARALRRGALDPGRARAGGELHRPGGARDGPRARGVRRRERRHDPPRGGRERPALRVRPLRRGRAGGRELGAQERRSASTTGSSPARMPSTGRSASRRSPPASSARSRIRTSCAAERARVVAEVVGEVDGRAAERVVDAIVEVVTERHA